MYVYVLCVNIVYVYVLCVNTVYVLTHCISTCCVLTCYSVLTPSLVYVLCVNAIGAVVGPYVLTVGVGITESA